MTDLKFKAYPNPTSEKLYLEFFNINQHKNLEVSFYDVLGKKAYSSNLNPSGYIDVSNLKKGLYLLKVTTKERQLKSSLISIQ